MSICNEARTRTYELRAICYEALQIADDNHFIRTGNLQVLVWRREIPLMLRFWRQLGNTFDTLGWNTLFSF